MLAYCDGTKRLKLQIESLERQDTLDAEMRRVAAPPEPQRISPIPPAAARTRSHSRHLGQKPRVLQRRALGHCIDQERDQVGRQRAIICAAEENARESLAGKAPSVLAPVACRVLS